MCGSNEFQKFAATVMDATAEQAKVNTLFVARYGLIHLSQIQHIRNVAVDTMSENAIVRYLLKEFMALYVLNKVACH